MYVINVCLVQKVVLDSRLLATTARNPGTPYILFGFQKSALPSQFYGIRESLTLHAYMSTCMCTMYVSTCYYRCIWTCTYMYFTCVHVCACICMLGSPTIPCLTGSSYTVSAHPERCLWLYKYQAANAGRTGKRPACMNLTCHHTSLLTRPGVQACWLKLNTVNLSTSLAAEEVSHN